MTQAQTGIRNAAATTFTWAAVWGGGFGGGIELLSNLGLQLPFTALVDIWPIVAAVPGVLGAAAFGAILLLLARGQRVDEVAGARLAGFGAVAGLLVGLYMVRVGIGEPEFAAATRVPFTLGVATMLGGISAIASRRVVAWLGQRQGDAPHPHAAR